MHQEPETKPPRTNDEIRSMALAVASELQAAVNPSTVSSGGGSRNRGLSEDLRMRFVMVRAALFQRGLFDPVLVRFDTATGAQASNADVAEQLKAVAASL